MLANSVHHLSFTVTDLARSRKFYEDIMGLVGNIPVAVFSVSSRFEDDRVNQNQCREETRPGASDLGKAMTPHRVANPNDVPVSQMREQLADVLRKTLPYVWRTLFAASVASHVNRVNVAVAGQEPDHLVPAAGVKTRGMNKKSHRFAINSTFCPIATIALVPLQNNFVLQHFTSTTAQGITITTAIYSDDYLVFTGRK